MNSRLHHPAMKFAARSLAVKRARAALLLAAVWLVTPTLWAQIASAAVTGIVRDTGGAVVPGATVELTQTDTNSRRTVTTNGDGVFTAAALAPGEYRIIVSMAASQPSGRSPCDWRPAKPIASMPCCRWRRCARR